MPFKAVPFLHIFAVSVVLSASGDEFVVSGCAAVGTEEAAACMAMLDTDGTGDMGGESTFGDSSSEDDFTSMIQMKTEVLQVSSSLEADRHRLLLAPAPASALRPAASAARVLEPASLRQAAVTARRQQRSGGNTTHAADLRGKTASRAFAARSFGWRVRSPRTLAVLDEAYGQPKSIGIILTVVGVLVCLLVGLCAFWGVVGFYYADEKKQSALQDVADGPLFTRKATDPVTGLSTLEVKQLLLEHGHNALEPAEMDGFFTILLTQMKNLIFMLSGIAAIICYSTGDKIKGTFLSVLVGCICLANAIAEWSGQDPSAALAAMMPESATATRDGLKTQVPVEDLVPGDIVHVKIGDTIPADLRVLSCVDLQTIETVLTGEPNEVNKTVEEKETETAFPSNMLYKSTGVVAGSGVAQVTATGMKTEVGLIAKRLKANLKADGTEDTTQGKRLNPLQVSINKLGKIIGAVCAVVISVGCIASFALGYQSLPPQCMEGDMTCLWWDSFVRGLLLAVAIIPHGLPLVVMVMLRVASRLMADQNGLVTRRSAVDYLGATQVICTDKTGTLTEGKMAAKALMGLLRDAPSASSGAKPSEVGFYPLRGLSPAGGVYAAEQLTEEVKSALDRGVPPHPGLEDLALPSATSPQALVAKAALAAAYVSAHGTRVVKVDDGSFRVEGNMSDAALKVAAQKGYLEDGSNGGRQLRAAHPREEDLEIPFSSKRKMSATIHRLPEDGSFSTLSCAKGCTHICVLKGAPDRVLPHLGATLALDSGGKALALSSRQMVPEERKLIEGQNQILAKQALRSLLLAVRPLTATDVTKLKKAGDAESRLQVIVSAPGSLSDSWSLAFLGLWGIFDPPRSTVPHSIKLCHEAHIRVVMITGDQQPTAVAIAKHVGLLTGDSVETQARPCKDMHHDQPAIAKKLSRQISRGNVPEDGLARTLSVHDVKTQQDSHEPEYKDTETLVGMASEVCVWSRAQPTDKVAIVDSLMNEDTNITAMTGDGVNDAPAL
jgi:magnesium-transporting ATPase (P-type)